MTYRLVFIGTDEQSLSENIFIGMSVIMGRQPDRPIKSGGRVVGYLWEISDKIEAIEKLTKLKIAGINCSLK